MYSIGEFREFKGEISQFLYLVPSGGIVELSDLSKAVLDRFRAGATSTEQVVSDLLTHGFAAAEITGTVEELFELRALRDENGFANIVQEPPSDFPLQT